MQTIIFIEGNIAWKFSLTTTDHLNFRPDLPSPTSEGNSKILEDLQKDRTKLTSEGGGTDDQCKDMEHRQPDVNHNGVDRSDSLNNGSLSPRGPLTSFHGLNIIADQMGQEGEGKTIRLCYLEG